MDTTDNKVNTFKNIVFHASKLDYTTEPKFTELGFYDCASMCNTVHITQFGLIVHNF